MDKIIEQIEQLKSALHPNSIPFKDRTPQLEVALGALFTAGDNIRAHAKIKTPPTAPTAPGK